MLNAFRDSMLDCEIYRTGTKLGTYKGLVDDTKEYNVIRFEPNSNVDVQVGDDIFVPIKNKHYLITNVEISTFCGERHSIDAYFDNSFTKPTTNMTFNTYNPNNSIIGTQANANININESFNNLDNLINQYGNDDKVSLNELVNTLKSELDNNQINKNKFSKFSDLIAKHSWLPLAISQIIAAWIQRG